MLQVRLGQLASFVVETFLDICVVRDAERNRLADVNLLREMLSR